MKNLDPAMDEQKADVDLTPLLDVVFIMLVFFIITASFIDEAGIPVTSPANAGDVPEDVESIVVRVEPASIFRVENRVLSRGGLYPYLTALYSQNPEATFGVVVVKGSVVRDMVAAADAGRMLGFDVIPISAEE